MASAQRDMEAKKFAPQSARANVYLIRHGFGPLETIRVKVDGNWVGDLPPGTYQLLQLAPGRHVFDVQPKLSIGYAGMTTPSTLEAGQNYYYQAQVGLIKIKLSPISEATGQKLIPGKKLVATVHNETRKLVE